MKSVCCKKCFSERIVKAGFVHKKQRYKCCYCHSYFLLGNKKTYSNQIKQVVAERYTDGTSIRSIARFFKVSHVTIIRWIRQLGSNLKTYLPTHAQYIEIDELYAYVKCKKNRKWVWIALCRTTKRILGFQIGSRGKRTLQKLFYKIQPIQTEIYFTDRYSLYKSVLPGNKHSTIIGGTNTIEGINTAIRRYLTRFHRRSVCYSKSEHMLYLSMQLLANRFDGIYQSTVH